MCCIVLVVLGALQKVYISNKIAITTLGDFLIQKDTDTGILGGFLHGKCNEC